MNTKQVVPLNDLLAMFQDCSFILSRRDEVGYEGVQDFVNKARAKGINDFNIAGLIGIVTPEGLKSAIVLSKNVAAGVEAPAASAFYGSILSTITKAFQPQFALSL